MGSAPIWATTPEDGGPADTAPDSAGDTHTGDTDPTDTAAAFCEGVPTLAYTNFGEGFLRENCQGCHASTTADRYGAPDTVVFDTRDAANRFYSPSSTHQDVLNRGPFRGHPLTGPVRVRGARPGDTLVVEVVEVVPALDFGWTAIRPGRGLLPETDFDTPYLQIWDLSDKHHARMPHGIAGRSRKTCPRQVSAASKAVVLRPPVRGKGGQSTSMASPYE
jgi:hypothetical protein